MLRRPAPATVLHALQLAAPGWPVELADDGIRIDAVSSGFQVSGGGVHRVADDAWEAASWVLAAAIGSAAEALRGGLVLNAGALLTRGQAIAFAGESHAGKSSTALHLAAIGTPLLGDDRLILGTGVPDTDSPVAIGLGLARKVRTPLPDDFSTAAIGLAAGTRAGHAAGADILGWDPAIDRPAGTAAALAGVVVLRRDPQIERARATRLGAAEAAATLLPLCGRHAGQAAALVEAVAGLVRRLPVDRLDTPDSAAAANALLSAWRP